MSSDISGIDMNKRIFIIYVNKDTLEIVKNYSYWGKYMPHVPYKEPEIPENCVKLNMDEKYGLSQIKIVKNDNEYKIVYAPEKDKIEIEKLRKEEAREKRNKLLIESDWTTLSDVPLSDEKKNEWKKYRQQLRDIIDNMGITIDNYNSFHINDILWPIKPI
jgi:hypothetical protein